MGTSIGFPSPWGSISLTRVALACFTSTKFCIYNHEATTQPRPDNVNPKHSKVEIPTRRASPPLSSPSFASSHLSPGFTTCVCAVLSFTTIPDPAVVTFTREQAGREFQTCVLSIKPSFPQISLLVPLRQGFPILLPHRLGRFWRSHAYTGSTGDRTRLGRRNWKF